MAFRVVVPAALFAAALSVACTFAGQDETRPMLNQVRLEIIPEPIPAQSLKPNLKLRLVATNGQATWLQELEMGTEESEATGEIHLFLRNAEVLAKAINKKGGDIRIEAYPHEHGTKVVMCQGDGPGWEGEASGEDFPRYRDPFPRGVPALARVSDQPPQVSSQLRALVSEGFIKLERALTGRRSCAAGVIHWVGDGSQNPTLFTCENVPGAVAIVISMRGKSPEGSQKRELESLLERIQGSGGPGGHDSLFGSVETRPSSLEARLRCFAEDAERYESATERAELEQAGKLVQEGELYRALLIEALARVEEKVNRVREAARKRLVA